MTADVMPVPEILNQACKQYRLLDGECVFNVPERIRESESALEKAFWHEMGKCTTPFKSIEAQKECGRYRLDAYFNTLLGRRIAVELDGKAYHDPHADSIRDRAILRKGYVDEIIRIPFAAMWYYPNATFRVLILWNRSFNRKLPRNVFSWSEYNAERKSIDSDIRECGGEGNYLTIRDWDMEVEHSYEIYGGITAESAFVGSQSAMNSRYRANSNLTPIKRFTQTSFNNYGEF